MITQNRGFGKINVFFLLWVGILLVVRKKMVGVCGGSGPGVVNRAKLRMVFVTLVEN